MVPDRVVAEVRDGRRRPFYWIDNVLNTEYAPRVHASGLAVYGVLAMHAGETGSCVLSLDTIAREAGLRDRDTVAAALEKLIAEHLIMIERGRGRRSVYRLLDVYQTRTETLRPARPSARVVAGELTTDGEPDLPKKPAAPAQKTGRLESDLPKKPAAPAQKTGRFEPNLPKKPAPTIDIIDNRYSRRIEIDDDTRTRELSSSSSPSTPAAPAELETWDGLTALYGLDAVQHARRVAANPAKKNDFAYIRGVLKRLARRGRVPTGSGVFGDQRPESGDRRPESGLAESGEQVDVDGVDGVDTEGAAVDPVWGAAVEGLRQAVTRGTFDAYVRDARLVGVDGDALVIEVRTAGARDWMKARLAGRVREAWAAAGGSPVSRVQFVMEGER